MVSKTPTFPTISIPTPAIPIEVTLIGQLAPGQGSELFAKASARQAAHPNYIDALDEPSAKIGGLHLEHDDASSLYSFGVGHKGHPFHKHEGNRTFTAISGSGGTQLRFCTASQIDFDKRPEVFFEQLRYINIPPDCIFTVRFGGGTWHQFMPLSPVAKHPAFFALSCHTNELGGIHDAHIRTEIEADRASIPALTDVLPSSIADQLNAADFDHQSVRTTFLGFTRGNTLPSKICHSVRSGLGTMKSHLAHYLPTIGFSHS